MWACEGPPPGVSRSFRKTVRTSTHFSAWSVWLFNSKRTSVSTSINLNENVVLSHKTWVNGKIAGAGADMLARLKVIAGEVKPYVLDISWQDPEGKTRFQRIPVGH